VVASAAVAAFMEVGHVTVVCCAGCADTNNPVSTEMTIGPRLLQGLTLTSEEAESAVVPPRYSEAAKQAIDESDLVVCIERVLAQPPNCPIIVILGGWAYPHCRVVASSPQWDWMAVPSRDVKAGLGLEANHRVVVIENAVDSIFLTSRPAPCAPSSLSMRVLFASRPTPEKGLLSAVSGVRALRSKGFDATLTYIASELPGFGSCDDVIPDTPWLIRIPWQARAAMPGLYRAHDVTLCLSSIPEGFGLVAAESLASGTPVVATPAGHLAHLARQLDGMFYVSMDARAEEVAKMVLAAVRFKREGEMGEGVVIGSSSSAMRWAYRELAALAITRRERERSRALR
jgi:glycosyltransferase involved in cell wall biosynthesis